MRKVLIIIASIMLVCSCVGIKSVSKGLENEAYLDIIGNTDKYKSEVLVSIDEDKSFKTKVRKGKENKINYNVFAISTGKHVIKIYYNNVIVLQKTIFVSSQETKQIILP
ncbi:MAG: hypothetical protein WBG43_06800 [Marinifilaceae bacterium]